MEMEIFGKPSSHRKFDDMLSVSHFCEASKAVGVAGGRVCCFTTFLVTKLLRDAAVALFCR